MREFLARLNIQYFQRKLAEETDQLRRDMLQQMLAEEKAKLAALIAAKQETPQRSEPG
jgi:hypothetical protein